MRTAVFLAALALATPASAETLLRLSETAHVAVKPDEIVAVLRAEAVSATAAVAQARVNALVAKLLDAAKANPGITTATGNYNVYQRREPTVQWNAVQTVQLRGADGERMLALVGTLQGQSLALDRLSWQLAAPTARKAQAEATRIALAALRARAEDAAKVLGLRFDSFKEIRLDPARNPASVAFRAMAAPPPLDSAPRAEAEDADITATVEADAVLTAP